MVWYGMVWYGMGWRGTSVRFPVRGASSSRYLEYARTAGGQALGCVTAQVLVGKCRNTPVHRISRAKTGDFTRTQG